MGLNRREFLRLSSALMAAGYLGVGCRPSETGDADVPEEHLAPYEDANIDWRQAEGESITVLATDAHYFEKFRSVTPTFAALTGINVEWEIIPPKEMRDKAVLDLSSGTANYATHSADPMFLPLFEARGWTEPLDDFLNDSELTDAEWFDLEDIVPKWREHNTVNGKLYGMPLEGEATIHIYRADVLDQLGMEPPDTLDELRRTAAEAHSDERAGLALRGFQGAGQNMYIWPSIFLGYGGQWFDGAGNPAVNSEEGVAALEYYVDALTKYAPRGVENWNWPEIMEAFAGGNVTQYIDANSTASVIENPANSQVAGEIGYKRWPTGPSGRRVTSIWNWAFPVNAALSDEQKKATWLLIQWLASRPAQMLSATFKETEDALVRTGVNRISMWDDSEYRKVIDYTEDYADVVLTSIEEDTDPDWRPRIPEWPEIGDEMAIAVQSALVGQKAPKEALDDANAKIASILGV